MKTASYIFIWILIIGLIVTGAIFLVRTGTKADLDEFASCLKEEDVTFYGAFWCQHCQAQKALFGKSLEKLPYVECSTPDSQNTTQICLDKKIESYPSWTFPKGFTVKANTEPIVCPKQPTTEDQPAICSKGDHPIGSTNFKVWKFGELLVRSNTDPVHTGDQWKFDPDAFANGELPLEFLAEQTGCKLPPISD